MLWLAIIGLILVSLGLLVVTIDAFRVNLWWGLACVFIPFAAVVFIILYTEKARAGLVGILIGCAMMAIPLWYDRSFYDPYREYATVAYWQNLYRAQTGNVVHHENTPVEATRTVSIHRCASSTGTIRYSDLPCPIGERDLGEQDVNGTR